MKTVNKIFLSVIGLVSSVSMMADLVGDWSGPLVISPSTSLRLVMHVSEAGIITLDSPDQKAYGLECDVDYLDADSIAVELPALKMKYSGRKVGENIDGIFKQGPLSLPLLLSPSEEQPIELKRPQTPVPPFPYSSEEVRVANPEAEGVVLAGTLTLPEKFIVGRTPVAVLVSGSGAQNRDEELMSHKPFAVISDYLARRGVATLRYDDRGFADSTGDRSQATTADYAADAAAVINWLRSSGRFGNVGLIGHSEGGMIGCMLAGYPLPQRPDFIVSVAGPAQKGVETLAYQNRVNLIKNGISEQDADGFADALKHAVEYLLENNDNRLTPEKIKEFYPQGDTTATGLMLKGALQQSASTLVENPWFAYFLNYDPSQDIRNIKVPTLILYGEKDMQVSGIVNMKKVQELNPSIQVRLLPGLNHLMQKCETGSPEEYSEIEETFNEAPLKEIEVFIVNGK